MSAQAKTVPTASFSALERADWKGGLTSVELYRFTSFLLLNDGCWGWTGGTDHGGYGRFKIRGTTQGAHRVSWIHHKGPIPNALHVLHKCDNPPCVRPSHLFLGTDADNRQDCENKGRSRVSPAILAQKLLTHCPYGHPYSGPNLITSKSGKRACRECWRIAYHRKREANGIAPGPSPRYVILHGVRMRLSSAATQIGICGDSLRSRLRHFERTAIVDLDANGLAYARMTPTQAIESWHARKVTV